MRKIKKKIILIYKNNMTKSSQLTLNKLFKSLLLLILTIASVYFVIYIKNFLDSIQTLVVNNSDYVKKFLDSIQTLVVINSESLNAVLNNISTITNTEQNKELQTKLEAALDNIATFKVSLWGN